MGGARGGGITFLPAISDVLPAKSWDPKRFSYLLGFSSKRFPYLLDLKGFRIFGSKRFSYLWGSHPKRFSQDQGFSYLWIQKIFVTSTSYYSCVQYVLYCTPFRTASISI